MRMRLFQDEWDFCRFVDEYRKPENLQAYYVVTPMVNRALRADLPVPGFLRCTTHDGKVIDTL